MAKSVDEYEKDVVKALKAHNLYTQGLKMQVRSLASGLRTLDMANEEADGLTKTTVLEKTRYGEKLAPHPVFKILKEAQELVTRQMKSLGLTAEDLAGDTDEDPMVDVTKKLIKKRKAPTIIRPSENKDADK